MIHRVLADLVLVAHLAFIVFVLGGGLLWLRWRWTPLVQIPAAIWGVWVEVSGRICPLTPLENALRRSAGASGYTESFVEHYLLPAVYPPGLTPEVQGILAGAVVLVNAVAYTVAWRVRRRARARG